MPATAHGQFDTFLSCDVYGDHMDSGYLYWTRGKEPFPGQLPFIFIADRSFDAAPLRPSLETIAEGKPYPGLKPVTIRHIHDTTEWFVRTLASYLDD